ncbi:hypothetical protein PPTG_24949 [Phytophthora nicotianae INRA-310]|uniref:Uncharacterized protein n=1 Tax=Phytophthora nicotianae (strain INRA-310) TaxID=761204 RepID=W2P9V2_PHYN3|nr:hypothetical protein PPTG_24949 [Phytophthora nicotianae INRA-310]ETM97440.1 hypothetical protein PPTG_24949 [Phytophthora nicotianae INRA-310]
MNYAAYNRWGLRVVPQKKTVMLDNRMNQKKKLEKGDECSVDWLILKKEEMEILALDEDALKGCELTDGILLDLATHRREAYPGLLAGGYGPTQEILDLAECPLGLFFFFTPP